MPNHTTQSEDDWDDLRLMFGTPSYEARAGGGSLTEWCLGAGNGIILCRSAANNRMAKEPFDQALPLLDMAKRESLRPRYLLAAGGVSGTLPLTQRPDLQRVFDIVQAEHLTWLAVRDASRIARDLVTLQMFGERASAAGLTLYQAGGAVPWPVLGP